ncbi:hypothetical protein YWIDRAFT_07695 [Streptomyces sp. SceaMP-e96]|uniref:hypothetical protein n=1 Tax=Streptomyces TaxID=1883 RepID=UPI000823A7E6|nr:MULTISPECIES: hypothetical protein [unclassified Streptomyces]MYT18038.1 hypothetical protein [Streptomyces sp. SID4951]SCK50503.1 hypothetical protein YWIDRAFT_07695 [Streptomyces sp. SceaMP-e96]
MDASQPLRVPVGRDARRWSTFRGEKTLVVAARTVTSTARVLECLPALLRGDSRVTVVFAHDPTSAFNGGVLDLLHDSGCRVMSWGDLASATPDLILSASENIQVPQGDCPVLVLPHGIGFQKQVPDSRGPHSRLSGMVSDQLLESGRAWLAISHPNQEEQLLATHPKAAGRTLLVGDPCMDELLVSADRAGAYKAALGIPGDQSLVVLSSTWGPTSLIGQDPALPAHVLAALPYDEFRVAAIIHPNVWFGHGSWQIRTLLADALGAGLILIPPVHTWRAALVAADAIVGDHGSVTLYGAALGKPVLLAAFGSDAVPGTAVDSLSRAAPRLDPLGDMHQQITSAMGEHQPNRYRAVSTRAFAQPGKALPRLRSALYGLLKLPEPVTTGPPLQLMLPQPEQTGSAVSSWTVTTTASVHDDRCVLTVWRRPAAVSAGEGESTGTFIHLACDEQERDPRLIESASVMIHRCAASTTPEALRWIRDTFGRLPGCRLAAVAMSGGGFLVGLRDGRVVEATTTGPTADPGVLAAVVYTLLRTGAPLDDGVVTLRVGEVREEDVAFRLRPCPPAV